MDTSVPENSALSAAENTEQQGQTLERGTYEIIRGRLAKHASELRSRLEKLNTDRRTVFGSIETRLLSSARITTDNNCVARDMVPIGDRFLFGYNVQLGLRSETKLADVFAVHAVPTAADEEAAFRADKLALISDQQFATDFRDLYRFYKKTQFAKFFVRAPHLYMVFRVGKAAKDVKAFKWLMTDSGTLQYVDNRSEHEVRFPAQHEFEWKRTHRDLHRDGTHPHISIEDRLFVETVGGDLTIKIEDNTESGQGIYAEDVEDPDQTLDDAEYFYSIVGNIILLKIRPYQENDYRYFAYSEKIQRAMRLDALADACVLLPQGHGLIFSNGYYLQNGECKTFENNVRDLQFERRIAAPNGEDFLYVFYNADCGTYVLLQYNLIEQRVETPTICNGYSLFDDGRMIYFKAGEEAQKHHTVQVWQTPLTKDEVSGAANQDSMLFKIGNQEIVRAMAECHEIAGLATREDSYANLYVDLVKKSDDLLSSYFWLNEDAAQSVGAPIAEVKAAAEAAVDEFDRVVRVRRETRESLDEFVDRVEASRREISARRFLEIADFVESLTRLRTLRGNAIGLKELRYVDIERVEQIEVELVEHQDKLAHGAVDFLLREDALKPYQDRITDQHAAVDSISKVTEGKELEEAVDGTATELEMLVDVVSNLKIDDATKRTEIIDNISAVFSHVHQTRAALRSRVKELLSSEGEAEFHSQLKLMGQSVANYLDVSDTPERCDEYLTKLMVQVEELEGRFAEFDDLLVSLAEKRNEIYSAFDGRKVALVEQRNRRATNLMNAADRILKGITTRVAGLEEVDEIHSYFASDLMVDKVRDIVAQLNELGDTVKVDDVQSRLKMVQDDSIRQLKDRRELYVDGENIIAFGDHKFTVNTQPLELTTVVKDEQLCFHLTGTNFLQPIIDDEIDASRALWDQSTPAENRNVYRGEFLAYHLLESVPVDFKRADVTDQELLPLVHEAMGKRHSDGYLKGVHDVDAAKILAAMLQSESHLADLKAEPDARALALLAWASWDEAEHVRANTIKAQCANLGAAAEALPSLDATSQRQLLELQVEELLDELLNEFDANFSDETVGNAAAHLVRTWEGRQPVAVSATAASIVKQLRKQVASENADSGLKKALMPNRPVSERFRMAQVWVHGFIGNQNREGEAPAKPRPMVDDDSGLAGASLSGSDFDRANEAAAILATSSNGQLFRAVEEAEHQSELTQMLGDHPRIQNGAYAVDYHKFVRRMAKYAHEVVPQFHRLHDRKQELIASRRDALRLDEFRPQVLTSFVRNRLIDQVYLPMIGDNLAKQMGAAGDEKRTDRMGLLLLISPPGYGKTTLMEYIANRLGITFVKINGPAIGHHVTSLDPTEAPHASARSEVEKLNLALEMGDNVMIYVDDIQHCHPEFLQKFISLCDAQRKIEGVFDGKARTYDLRGRKVAVVMAGNPYTESGQRFTIPDMLANRADTYNLGDVIGSKKDAFELSYLENALTSNNVLRQLAQRNQSDVYSIVEMARDGQGNSATSLEGNYSVEQVNEFVAVMKKLVRIRDVVLAVNDQYIRSAAQADEYRTEPPFKMQGSYRDMNKLAERIVPIMNDEELDLAITAHYENQAQTLTSGAEANLLKLNEMLQRLTEEQAERWASIKKTFNRNQLLGQAGGDDRFGQVVAQMSALTDGLDSIRDSVTTAATEWVAQQDQPNEEPLLSDEQVQAALAHMAAFGNRLDRINKTLEGAAEHALTSQPDVDAENTVQEVHVVHRVPRVFMDVIQSQFRLMQSWSGALNGKHELPAQTRELQARLAEACKKYEKLLQKLERAESSAIE